MPRRSRPKETGNLGERLAASFLVEQGYTIVEMNARTRFGELDIVAREGNALVFVEVKTRRGEGYGLPEEAITPKKIAQLIALSESYLEGLSEQPDECRIDVVAIELAPGDRVVRCQLYRNITG